MTPLIALAIRSILVGAVAALAYFGVGVASVGLSPLWTGILTLVAGQVLNAVISFKDRFSKKHPETVSQNG